MSDLLSNAELATLIGRIAAGEDPAIEELGLSVRARNCLGWYSDPRISTLSELCAMSEAQLRNVKNLGTTTYYEIKGRLETLGLSVGRFHPRRTLVGCGCGSCYG